MWASETWACATAPAAVLRIVIERHASERAKRLIVPAQADELIAVHLHTEFTDRATVVTSVAVFGGTDGGLTAVFLVAVAIESLPIAFELSALSFDAAVVHAGRGRGKIRTGRVAPVAAGSAIVVVGVEARAASVAVVRSVVGTPSLGALPLLACVSVGTPNATVSAVVAVFRCTDFASVGQVTVAILLAHSTRKRALSGNASPLE